MSEEDDVLSEDELAALSDEAKSTDDSDDGSARAISLESFERRARLPLFGLETIAESFAEDATSSCTHSIGQVVELRSDGLRGSSVEEYANSLEIPSHITPVDVSGGLSGRILLVLGATVVDGLVHRRFGGRMGGRGSTNTRRALTTAERRLGDELVASLVADLERSLMPVTGVSLKPGVSVGSPRLTRPITRPRAPVIVATFTMSLGESEGRIDIALPQDLLAPVEMKLRAGLPDRAGGAATEDADGLRRATRDIELDLVARVAAQRLTLRQVSALQPGSVLQIDPPEHTARLMVGDVAIAVGGFGVAGDFNAIRIDRMLIAGSSLGNG